MPIILSPFIHENMPGLWFEGSPYTKENIYSIETNKSPPVNYDTHIIKSHSLTHVEASSHTQKDGMTIGEAYLSKLDSFYGEVAVIRLKGNEYKCVDKEKGIYHWIITKKQIESELQSYKLKLKKIFITTDFQHTTQFGFHDPNYVLTLSQEAANYLVNDLKINLYGTSWKSSDYNPGSLDRPIHNTLFKTALIVECLKLKDVVEGVYFLVCLPLPIKDASESPVVPVLFTKDEIKSFN